MVAQIFSFLIIAYLLFIFPLLFGALFIKARKKEVTLSYLYGMTGVLAVFLLTEVIFLHFGKTLSVFTAAYAGIIGIISVCAIVFLIWQRAGFELPWTYRYHYLAAGVLALIFTLFRLDNSTDGVLETAMMALHTGEMYGYSPYTGQMLTETIALRRAGAGGLLPAFYAVLSRLSGVHVTVIGKLIMPFGIVIMALTAYRLLVCRCLGMNTKRSLYALWFVLLAWVFICFQGFAGYRLMWEAPWTPESLIFYCLLPFLVTMFVEKEWNRCFSILFALVVVAFLLLFPVNMWKSAKEMLFFLLISLVLYALLQIPRVKLGRVIADGSHKRNTGRLIIPLIGAVLAVLSVIFHGCIITDSQYAVPDNRYKMDAEVMQLRLLMEPVGGEIKMLAPPRVCAQIRDADLKINLLFGPDALDAGDDAAGIRLKGIAQDLESNKYEPIKLIQHAGTEKCNYVVSYKEAGEEKAQEELFFQYGFLKIGETASYELYEFIGDSLDYSTASNQVVIE